MKNLDSDTVALLSKRVYDLAGCTDDKVRVYLNGKKITKIKDFASYVGMYFKKEVTIFHEKCGARWEICVVTEE